MPDPSLTPLGESQCKDLRTAFPYHDKITHLVASPLRRTIYTCLLSFESSVIEKGLKVIALPELQETSDLPADTGSDPSKLKHEFDAGKWHDTVDLSLVEDGWNDKSHGTRWAPTPAKLDARARLARLWLRELGSEFKDDAEIVVVTHGGYLHYFTEDWDGHNNFTGTRWQNTESRSYVFKSDADKHASLVETPESRQRRKVTPLTETEQLQLRAAAQRQWEEEGFMASGATKL